MIRRMVSSDEAEVLAIERASFEFPWSEDDFLTNLAWSGCAGFVAVRADQVVGYMVFEFDIAYLQLLNFAVHPDYRRQGIGRSLVRKLISRLYLHPRDRILLEVRESNLAAQLFFRAEGFRATDIVRDLYDDTPEDAYRMEYTLAAGELSRQVAAKIRIGEER